MDRPRSRPYNTPAAHFLRFEFTPAAIAALRAGAGLSVGIEDPRLPAHVDVADATRAALLADFAG